MELPVEPSKPGTATEYDVEPDEDTAAVVTQAADKETYKRVLKSTTTEKHSYIYASGKLLRETVTGNGTTKILDFRYDQSGAPYSLTYTVGSSSTVYYYITNLQGDVMFLVDGKGNQVAAYTYDPYGKVLTSSGTMAEINPLRYRGYYQDSETGFYYLQSRYYDPTICRFINADSYASTGQGLIGYNAFAYCLNKPTQNVDDNGEWGISTLIKAGIGAVVNAVCTAVTGGSAQDVAKSFVVGAIEGALSDGIPLVGTVLRVYHTAKTVIRCRKSGASWGTSLLAGGLALASSYVYGRENDELANALVDMTFGLASSAMSEAVTTAIERNAQSPSIQVSQTRTRRTIIWATRDIKPALLY